MNEKRRMPLLAALEAISELRSEEIVVTTMGAAREWPRLSQHPLDFASGSTGCQFIFHHIIIESRNNKILLRLPVLFR